MGLGHSERANRTYVQIVGNEKRNHGKGGVSFAIRAEKGADGAVSRINKKEQEVWEHEFETLSGTIRQIDLRESDFGKQWNITIADIDKNGEVNEYVLTDSYSSQYIKTLFNKLCSLTPAQISDGVLQLEPYFFPNKEKPGKFIRGMALYVLDGEKRKIDSAYTKDDIPPMDQVVLKGENTWDDTKQIEFFKGKIEQLVKPHLGNARSWFGAAAVATEEPEQTPGEPIDNELPF